MDFIHHKINLFYKGDIPEKKFFLKKQILLKKREKTRFYRILVKNVFFT